MFLKEKRNGTIKEKVCADEPKQCKVYNNADATSSIVSTDAVLLSVVIDSYGEWDMAVIDITGAYLSAYIDGNAFMIFCGTMAEFMVAADPTLYHTPTFHT